MQKGTKKETKQPKFFTYNNVGLVIGRHLFVFTLIKLHKEREIMRLGWFDSLMSRERCQGGIWWSNTHTHIYKQTYTPKEEKEDREKEEVLRNISEYAPLFYGLPPQCRVISPWPYRRPRCARTLRIQNPGYRTERGKKNINIIIFFNI